MTSTNAKLKLAMLRLKKGSNLVEKGFTLVELMIVIVIVGILSAVALPNFMSQTEKARLTEAKSLAKAYLTNYHVASLDGTQATAMLSVSAGGACPEATNLFSFDCSTAGEITATSLTGGANVTATVDANGVISGI